MADILLQATDDPSLLVPVVSIWRETGAMFSSATVSAMSATCYDAGPASLLLNPPSTGISTPVM